MFIAMLLAWCGWGQEEDFCKFWKLFLNSAGFCFQTSLASQKVSQIKKLMRARISHCPSSVLLFQNQRLNGERNLLKKGRIFMP